MPAVQVSYAQIAQVGLATVNKAQISADDTSMALVGGLKDMLRGIASGTLVVSLAEGAAAPSPAAPVKAAVKTALAPPRGPRRQQPVPPHKNQDPTAGHVVTGPAPQTKLAGGLAARGGEGVVPAGTKAGPPGSKT